MARASPASREVSRPAGGGRRAVTHAAATTGSAGWARGRCRLTAPAITYASADCYQVAVWPTCC